MGCGANCTQASTFFTYDARRRTYVVAPWAHQPDWDTVGYGRVVHLDAMHDAIATMQPTPFDDCHVCLPGSVPVFYAISGERVVEISNRFLAALRTDAAAAWRASERVPSSQEDAPTDRDVALFRYLSDECRLGACAPAWHRVQGALPGSLHKDELAQMRSAIVSRRYGSL